MRYRVSGVIAVILLLAAIPATIFYNHFVGELRGLTAAIDLFAADCEGDLVRQASASRASAGAGQA